MCPICSCSYPISIILGTGEQLNPYRTQKKWSEEEKSKLWWKLLWYVQNIWKNMIFPTIFRRPYFWTVLWFFQSVKTYTHQFFVEKILGRHPRACFIIKVDQTSQDCQKSAILDIKLSFYNEYLRNLPVSDFLIVHTVFQIQK